MQEGWLTVKETKKLFKNAGKTKSLDEEELLQVYNWAVKARIDSVTLGAVLKNMVYVTVTDGAIAFRNVEIEEKELDNGKSDT